MLLALVLLIAGFFVQGTRGSDDDRGGMRLGSLAGLELSVREHFAGYKSHTTVLAGTVAVVAARWASSCCRTAGRRVLGLRWR